MKRVRHFAAIGALSLLPLVVLGQEPRPFNQIGVGFERYGFVISIDGFSADNQKVSGTKVEFTATAVTSTNTPGWLIKEPPAPGYAPYNYAYIKEYRLTLGGEVLEDLVNKNETYVGRKVKFASTHFTHLANVPIQVRALAVFTCTDPQGLLKPDNRVVELSYSVTVQAYNKGTFLATVETYVDGQPVVDPSSVEAEIAAECVGIAIPGTQALKHGVDPATVPAGQALRAADIAPKFKDSTTFFTVTHGLQSEGIRASHTDDMLYPWINQQVHENRTVPLYNVVVLIACNGVGNGTSGTTAGAFGVSDGENGRPPAVNQCVVAFWPKVAADKRNKVNLPLWTTRFYELLSEGYSVGESEKKIDLEGIKLFGSNGNAIRPKKIGDLKTRLKGYYGAAEGTTTWYIMTSLP
ncbi:MAG: hypothetical protein HND43_06930 [Armatimonadetes bacterium]|nr:hypothetical protein [Armatimonadota bacterium]NOG39115.1 hypothetical protein [Armatimonadota bacterium]GIK32227.1 MAG: hypothetical protein BroJett009_12190 [Armatimonadota bacterium]